MRREEADGGQVEPAFGYRLEQDGKLPCRAGGLDPLVGRILGKAQLLDAVGEEGRMAGRRVRLAGVDLGDMREEPRGGLAVSSRQHGKLTKQNGVAEMGQRVIAHEISCSPGRGLSQSLAMRQESVGVSSLYHELRGSWRATGLRGRT